MRGAHSLKIGTMPSQKSNKFEEKVATWEVCTSQSRKVERGVHQLAVRLPLLAARHQQRVARCSRELRAAQNLPAILQTVELHVSVHKTQTSYLFR